jgi:hypothetical protein
MQDTEIPADIPVEVITKVLADQKTAARDRRLRLLGIVVSVAAGVVTLANGFPVVPGGPL